MSDRLEEARLIFEMHHEMAYHEMCDVIERLYGENERLRAVLSALCDATLAAGEPCTCDWWSVDKAEHEGTCAIWAYRSARAAALEVLSDG